MMDDGCCMWYVIGTPQVIMGDPLRPSLGWKELQRMQVARMGAAACSSMSMLYASLVCLSVCLFVSRSYSFFLSLSLFGTCSFSNLTVNIPLNDILIY